MKSINWRYVLTQTAITVIFVSVGGAFLVYAYMLSGDSFSVALSRFLGMFTAASISAFLFALRFKL
jgi:hypothetical protein